MEEQWIGHMLETEGGDMSCLINIGLSENCPDPSRPLCTMIRIPFKDPEDHGFGSTEERDRFGEFEEAIEAAVRKQGAVHFASVRGMGSLDVWYYSPVGAGGAIAKAAEKVCVGYEIESGSQDDADWEQFSMLYPGPAAIAAFHDSQVIAVLREQGDLLETPREVDHAVYLPDESAAKAVETAALAEGFAVTDRQRDKDQELPYLLQLTKSHAVTLEDVTPVRSWLTELVEKHGGTYDGWQTPLVK